MGYKIMDAALEKAMRRHLTIVFSDLTDSTGLSARLEPEPYSALLDSMRHSILDILEKHGGTIIRIDGDGFVFVFGYPDAFEDSTRRAIEATLDIHEAMRTLGKEQNLGPNGLRFHSGIHAGVVLLRPGDASRGTFEILGEPTNLTARIAEYAQPEEIVVTDAALGGTRTLFKTSPLEKMTPRHGGTSLFVRKVLGRQDDNIRKAAQAFDMHAKFSTPFIGRSRDRTLILEALERDCTFVVVQAESGMGKTRLLWEITDTELGNGKTVLWSSCTAYLGTRALHPIKQLFYEVLSVLDRLNAANAPGEHAQLIAEIEATLASPPPVIDDAAIAKLAELILSANKIFCSADQMPAKGALIVVDDWQWIDNASRNVIEYLASHPDFNAKFLLGTRSLDAFFGTRNATEVFLLTPLTHQEIKSVAQTIMPDIDSFSIEKIQTMSGGNALFVEELSYAARRRDIQFKPETQSVWIKALIGDRVARLEESERNVLKAAAIIGDMVEISLLETVLARPVSATCKAILQAADFLFPHTTQKGYLQFKHGVTRTAIYDLIGLDERQALHKRLAEFLSDTGDDPNIKPINHAVLAYHYNRAGISEETIRHAILAGDSALESYALDKAQFHFETAFEHLEKKTLFDARLELVVKQYGMAAIVDPGWEQMNLFERAVRIAKQFQDADTLTQAYYWQSAILYGLGEPDRAKNALLSAKYSAQSLDNEKWLTQINASLGQIYAAAGDYRQAYDYLDDAIEIKRRLRSGMRPSSALAYAVSCKAFALADQGLFDVAEKHFEQALAYLQDTKHQAILSIMAHRSASAYWAGQFEHTIALADDVAELSHKMRSRYNYAMARTVKAAAEFRLDRNEDHLQDIESTSKWLLSGGSQQYASLNYGYLCDGYASIQNWEKCRKYAAQSLLRARKGDRLGECVAFRALTRMAHAGKSHKSPEHFLSRAWNAANLRQSHRERALTEDLAHTLGIKMPL